MMLFLSMLIPQATPIFLSMLILQVVMIFIQAMLHAIEAANASMLTDLRMTIVVPTLIPLAMSIFPFTSILQLMVTVMRLTIPQVMAIPFQHGLFPTAESIIQTMTTHTHRSTIMVVRFFMKSMPRPNELIHKFMPPV